VLQLFTYQLKPDINQTTAFDMTR